MRVVVVGASGNVGTSLLQALAAESAVDSVLGIARRVPGAAFAKTEWAAADVATSDLVPLFRGADAVVHLAWLIQPARNRALTRAVNVDGSRRVLRAAAEAGVGALVYASSVGAYAPAPKDRRVDESWPTTGIVTSFYSRDKAEVERLLDRFEHEAPTVRTVRLRPGLIFKREAASEIRRLFAGPLLPSRLVDERLIPILPLPGRLAIQGLHSIDAGHAYRLAVAGDARGAFNIAAEPVLDRAALAQLMGARPVAVSERVLRAAAAASYRLHLQPSEPGWLDLAFYAPLLDAGRARAELGWTPRYTADAALAELLAGLRERAGMATPPLDPAAGGPLRLREFASGIGSR